MTPVNVTTCDSVPGGEGVSATMCVKGALCWCVCMAVGGP